MNSRLRWRSLTRAWTWTGKQIETRHQGQGTVTFVLVIAHHGWAGAGQWRAIRRGRTDRLDPGFLVVRDDGEAPTAAVLSLAVLLFRPQHRHLSVDAEDLGHLGLELGIALFQVVAYLCGLTSCSAKILQT